MSQLKNELKQPLLSRSMTDDPFESVACQMELRQRKSKQLEKLHIQFRKDIQESKELTNALRPHAINQFLDATQVMPIKQSYSTLMQDLSKVEEPGCCDSGNPNYQDGTLLCGTTSLGLGVGGGAGAAIGAALGSSCCAIGLGIGGGVLCGVIGACIGGNIILDEPADDSQLQASKAAKKVYSQALTIYNLFSTPLEDDSPKRQSMDLTSDCKAFAKYTKI